jgi:hypothetical protein
MRARGQGRASKGKQGQAWASKGKQGQLRASRLAKSPKSRHFRKERGFSTNFNGKM